MVFTILILAFASASCGVTGVYLLLGLGWSLVAASVYLAAFALVLRGGLL